MPKMRAVSMQTRFRVAADYLDGEILKKIAHRYGLSGDWKVIQIAKSMGFPTRSTKFGLVPIKRPSPKPRGRPFQPKYLAENRPDV